MSDLPTTDTSQMILLTQSAELIYPSETDFAVKQSHFHEMMKKSSGTRGENFRRKRFLSLDAETIDRSIGSLDHTAGLVPGTNGYGTCTAVLSSSPPFHKPFGSSFSTPSSPLTNSLQYDSLYTIKSNLDTPMEGLLFEQDTGKDADIEELAEFLETNEDASIVGLPLEIAKHKVEEQKAGRKNELVLSNTSLGNEYTVSPMATSKRGSSAKSFGKSSAKFTGEFVTRSSSRESSISSSGTLNLSSSMPSITLNKENFKQSLRDRSISEIPFGTNEYKDASEILDKATAKRFRNAEAARVSRARKMKYIDLLESHYEELKNRESLLIERINKLELWKSQTKDWIRSIGLEPMFEEYLVKANFQSPHSP